MTGLPELTGEMLTLVAAFGNLTRHVENLTGEREDADNRCDDLAEDLRVAIEDRARLDRLLAAAVARLDETRDKLVAATAA
ncbi:hypothetical protein SAMN04515671_2951 [Nakamurella panacisegetis]|uniref:Uncharacterized protein n=1 Tax=Nakamurella panacisegetis TaxID=1090615 RepID=A0A1H0Q028_9ACTN|nr:hypothetical protein [Nakamurella panacisegetis]SDP10752.1 hypothetical protein SAMN04515671_2951 [Nakamurella panacisegetis]